MKPIRLSQHALDQMRMRGATEAEVRETIETASWQPARRGKLRARKSFPFGRPSPVNQQIYSFKIVDAIFAVEPNEIVVVTVLAYYGN
jgi:hypothetical protein